MTLEFVWDVVKVAVPLLFGFGAWCAALTAADRRMLTAIQGLHRDLEAERRERINEMNEHRREHRERDDRVVHEISGLQQRIDRLAEQVVRLEERLAAQMGRGDR